MGEGEGEGEAAGGGGGWRQRPAGGDGGGGGGGWITTFCFWKPDGRLNSFGGPGMNHKIDGVDYWALEPENKVSGWASAPVTVKWVDCGAVLEVRKCRMVAGSIGMRPGRHLDMGVRLEGLPLPPIENSKGGNGLTRANVSLWGELGDSWGTAGKNVSNLEMPQGWLHRIQSRPR